MIGITVDFRAGIACPAINRPVADDEVVFFGADQLLTRMNTQEFKTMARRRRQTPRELLHQVLRVAAAAAQRVLDGGEEEVRGKVLRLLAQGEVVPGRGGALHFELFV